MLSDRSYMRQPTWRDRKTVTEVLLWTWGIAYFAALILDFVFRWPGVVRALAWSASNLQSLFVWSPLTYALVHDVSPFHVLFNGLMLFFLGRMLEDTLGATRFGQLCFWTALGGALLWLPFHWSGNSYLMGGSAIVLGLLTVFCLRLYHDPVTFYIVVFPVTLPAKVILWITLFFNVAFFIIHELGGNAGQTAWSAHLGGMAMGWLFHRYPEFGLWNGEMSPGKVRQYKAPARREAAASAAAERARPLRPATAAESKATVAESKTASAGRPAEEHRAALRLEVDRILDKINDEGFGSLSAEEKRTLDRARDLLAK